MKNLLFPILLLALTTRGYMSGVPREFSLDEVVGKDDLVLSVTVIGSSNAYIREIAKAVNDHPESSEGRFDFYIAVIRDIVAGAKTGFSSDEKWTVEYDPIDDAKVRKSGDEDSFIVKPGDTIAIFHYETIFYSYIYHVEKRHKIFIYKRCPEMAGEIMNGQTYLFIADCLCSKKNSAFFGAMEFGLLNDTARMRGRIAKIIKRKQM